MTQAQFSQWLGVTIKQVKYLEHQRRNPSGPTRRLLDILALELKFDSAAAVQVLGASPTQLKKPTTVPKPKIAPIKRDINGDDAGLAAVPPSAEAAVADIEAPPPAPNGDAFVWL